MSKHLGNILEPIPLMDRHGADAVRWFMLANGSPWGPRRIGDKVLEEIAPEGAAHVLVDRLFQTLYAREPATGRLATLRRISPTVPSSTGGRCPRRTGLRWRSTPRWRRSTPSVPGVS